METRQPPEESNPDWSWLAARRAILNEIRLEGLPLGNIPALLNDDAVANRLSSQAQEKLENAGIEVDSLDLVEAVLDLIDNPWSSDDEEDGGSGVREPRRPLPHGSLGSIALPPEIN